MSAVFETELLDCSWGGIALDVVRTDDAIGRDLARHRYPGVSGARVRDLGGLERETACTVVFFGDGCIARFKAFLAAANEGVAKRLVHPLTGTYLAHAANLRPRATAEDRDYIVVDVDFVETLEEETFESVSTAVADTAATLAAIAGLSSDLAAAGVTSSVPALATSTSEGWEEDWQGGTLNARQINLELASLASTVQDEIDALDLALDVANYPLMRSYTRLVNNLRELGARYLSSAPKLTSYTVKVAQPLVAICQTLYGGAEAAAACERLLALNDVRNPALVEAGTILTVEVADAA